MMSPEEFLRAFPRICVGLNFEAFRSSSWPITIQTASAAESFAKIYTAWYFAPTRQTSIYNGVGYAESDAKPLRVSEASAALLHLPSSRQRIVEKYEDEFKTLSGHISISVPAYAVGHGRHLLLDGNHRVVAVAHIGKPFEIKLVTIEGPIQRRYLLDLLHWE